MILAAGLGTRLRPLTNHTPKALIPVGGRPVLDHVAERLIAAGADRLIINLHHLGEQVERHVDACDGYGVEVRFSRERPDVLETGGGLLQAAPLFRRDAPFFLHNGDILSDIPLREMYAAHVASGALATVAVMERATSRRLLFDEKGLLGWVNDQPSRRRESRPAVAEIREMAFTGVHVVSPEIFERMTERGAFSIMEPYLRLAGDGHRILPFRVDSAWWIDIGKPEALERARAEFAGA